MANTGNTQQQINYGAAVNDGNGDPLRTAFIKTDDNFDNVWLAGPVGSNITITNNTVQVNNTNGNLVLSPNGTGIIQTNSRLLPRLNNTYDFGSTTLKYRTGYFGTGGLVIDGNVTVAGNLTAGNISYTGNVFVGDLQGSVYADDSTIMVDAVDNELFAGRATISGNITADYFVGNGSQLTGLAASYGNANVVTLLSAFGSNTISTIGNISGNLIAPGANGQVMYNRSGIIGASPYDFNFDESTFTLYVKSASFSGEADGTDALYVGSPGYTFLGSDIMAQFTGNVNSYSQINFQNINPGALASGDYIITADNGTDSTYYLDIGLASSNHADPGFFGDTSSKNDAYIYVVGSDETGPSSVGGPGNLILGSTNGAIKMFVGNTAQANVVATIESDQLLMSGNIIPATSNVYSLGNATNQWSDLYVSNATIYMNNVPVTLAAGNVLTVAGQPLLSNDSNTSISTTGNITADYFIGDGSLLTGITGNITFTDTTISAPDTSPIVIQAVDTGSSIEAQISLDPDAGDLTIRGTNMNVVIDSTADNVEITAGADVSIEATDDLRLTGNDIVSLRNRSTTDPVTIIADFDNTEKTWEFGVDGTLTTPGDITVSGDVTGTAGASTLVLKAQPASNTSIQLNDSVDSVISTVANLEIRTDVSNTARTWEFDNTGTLTAPGNITATGNITGGNLISNSSLYANVDLIVGDRDNASASKGRFVSNSGFMYLQVGNGTPDSTGNIVFSPYQSSTARVTVDTASGNISATGNISGGNIITTGRVSASGNILGLNFATEGSVQASSVEATGNVTADIVAANNNDGTGQNIKVGDDTWLGDINISNTLSIRGQQDAANAYIVFGNASNVALGRAGTGPLTYGGDFSVSGNITGNTAGFAIGYRDIPQVSFTGNATIATGDAGKHFYSTQSTDYVLTIANNASQGFAVGAAITVVNQGSGTISIEQGSGVTLYLAGNASSGNRSVATFGMATIMKVATDTWFINGTGVS